MNRREYKSESVLEKTAEKEKDTKGMGNINTPDRVQIGKGGANAEIPRTPCRQELVHPHCSKAKKT